MKFHIIICFCISFFLLHCSPQDTSKRIDLAKSNNVFSRSEIIGGIEARANDLVSLSTVMIYDTFSKFICTGVLISQHFVLTASHCLGSRPEKMLILFSLNLASVKKEFVRNVFSVHPHPSADLAILSFKDSPPTQYLPVKFLKNFQSLKKYEPLLIAGFGIFQHNSTKGYGVLRQNYSPLLSEKPTDAELKLQQSVRSASCHGDSGGPAFVVRSKEIFLYGIASRGKLNALDNCQSVSIYTNVLSYSSWIAKAILLIDKSLIRN